MLYPVILCAAHYQYIIVSGPECVNRKADFTFMAVPNIFQFGMAVKPIYTLGREKKYPQFGTKAIVVFAARGKKESWP